MEPEAVKLARVRLPVVVFLVLTVQTSLLQGFHIANVHPDAMLLLAIAAGLARGPETGAVVGFCAGLIADLFVQTPLGLSALSFSLVGFSVGTVQRSMIRTSWWISPITALLASAGGVVLYALAGAVVGQTQMVTPHLGAVVAVVAVANAFLSLVEVPLVSWAFTNNQAERAFPR
jgi:rod shape-determining protein MreD